MLLLVNIIVRLITHYLTIGLQIYAEIVFSVVLINFVNSKLSVPQFTSKIKPENKLRIVCTTVWTSSGLVTFRLSLTIKGAQETQSVD